MKLLIALLSLPFAAACAPDTVDAGTEPVALEAQSTEAQSTEAQSTEAQSTEVQSIEGEYIVTRVGDAAPVIGIDGHQPTITIEADRIHFQSQCIYADWSYQRDGESITTGPFKYDEPMMMCARGLTPGETAIIEIMGKADTIRPEQGNLVVTGEWRTLTLTPQ